MPGLPPPSVFTWSGTLHFGQGGIVIVRLAETRASPASRALRRAGREPEGRRGSRRKESGDRLSSGEGISAGDEVDIKPSTWISVRANFEAGESIDVVGASGELDYDVTTGETASPIEVWGVESDGAGGYAFTTEAIINP